MAGGGAAVAAIAAARQRRIQETVDAFRLGDATAPARARRLEDLGVIESHEMRDLMVDGVIMPGPHEGTYYLSEPAYIYQRQDRRRMAKVVIITVLVIALLGAVILPLMVVRG